MDILKKIQNYEKDKPESIGGLIVSLLFYIPFFIVGLMVILSGIRIIDSIDPASYDSNIVIEDSIDVISDSDEMELQKAFEAFRDKTGISCALITADNETWSPYYSSLENYAYDLYVNHWTDEKHWLFVYTQPVGTESSSPIFTTVPANISTSVCRPASKSCKVE